MAMLNRITEHVAIKRVDDEIILIDERTGATIAIPVHSTPTLIGALKFLKRRPGHV